jgi:hypothetical protein
MAFEFAEIPYSLKEILVASYNITTAVYQDPVSVDGDQKFVLTPVSDTAEMRDSGAVSRVLAVKTHANVTLGMGGVDFSMIAALTGGSNASSGSTPNQIRKLTPQAAGTRSPYFGALAAALTDDGGVFAVGVRAIVLDDEPEITFDGTSNNFIVSETSGKAIAVSNQIYLPKSYETVALWESSKPTDAAEFLAWFSSF